MKIVSSLFFVIPDLYEFLSSVENKETNLHSLKIIRVQCPFWTFWKIIKCSELHDGEYSKLWQTFIFGWTVPFNLVCNFLWN